MRIIGCQILFDFVNNQVGFTVSTTITRFKFSGLKIIIQFPFLDNFLSFDWKNMSLHIFYILQIDGSYLFNLEGIIPKLCQLAQETGEDESARNSRSAGLKALLAMVFIL